MKERKYFTYIATNQRHTVLYTGVTNNVFKRAYQHENKSFGNSFTSKYNVNKVVYYEVYNNIHEAIAREKIIKGGSRERKIHLINSLNPKWKDLVNDELTDDDFL